MVDPHQVYSENYNNGTNLSTSIDAPNLPANVIPMNDSDPLKSLTNQETRRSDIDIQSAVNDFNEFDVLQTQAIYEQRQNVHSTQLLDLGEIMCGPSSQITTTSTIQSIDTNSSVASSGFVVAQNGNSTGPVTTANHFTCTTSATSTNNININHTLNVSPIKECVIVTEKRKSESNDLHQKQTIPSTSINSADYQTDEYSTAEYQTNTNNTVYDSHIDTNKMDSRKVEPLRININRDPIKTKIKLGPPGERQTMSPKSSSSSNSGAGIDECDDASEMPPENPQIYPKITIKPIVKPPTETELHHNHSAGIHAASSSSSSSTLLLSSLSTSSSSSSSTHEAIPKLKIKKVDSNNSNSNLTPLPTHSAALNIDDITGNYQTHLLTESSPSVPKLTTVRSSTTNLSIGSNSYDEGNCTASNEVVPKLTIKFDNHSQHSSSSDSPRSLVSNSGVKLTLKPISEPPIPKLTITNAFNDTAKVVMLNNSEQTDESSDELPSQPPSSQPSPNDKVSSRTDYATHAITSTSSLYSGANAEDNMSTCSSGSSSSYSSSSSVTNDIKLIIKATSTGSCVVSPNPASVVRNSPSSGKSANNVKVTSSKSSSGDSSKLNNITSNVVTSSTVNSTDSIPKLNIKLSNTDYPQVIHNDVDASELRNECGRTESPLPKLTIRMANTHDDNIVIPKVTIKPVVNPNETLDPLAAEAQLVTPKIILKSIPKPIEKPLEINTGGQGSPFRNSENESQQSPRIILKINKNTTSQTKESATLTSTTIIAEEPRSDSPQPPKQQNELKRPSNHESDIHTKKQKLNDDVVQLLSSDSEPDDVEPAPTTNNNHSDSSENQDVVRRETLEMAQVTTPNPPISFDSNSGLRSILSRPQMKIQPQPLQNFLQTLPPFKSTTSDSSSKTGDVIDLCHDSNDQMIGGASLDDDDNNDDDDDETAPMPMTSDQTTNQNADTTETNKNVTNKQRSTEQQQQQQQQPQQQQNQQQHQQNKKSNSNWQFFYRESEKEQIEPIHPLLQQNIERANVLAAMMEAANQQERSTNGSNNNNTAKNEEFSQTSSSTNLLIEHEGSSSDCIVIEDTASEPFPSEFASGENSTEQNGRKKDSVDRDSGVDVSNSVKSINEEETVTPVVKRPRGRPRKGTPATPKPAAVKKQGKTGKTPGPKRKFASVALSQSNVEVAEEGVEIPLIEESVLVVPALSQLPEAPIETSTTSKTLTEQQKSDEQLENAIKSIQPAETLTMPTILPAPAPAPATAPTLAPIAMDVSENSVNETSNQTTTPTLLQSPVQLSDLTMAMPMDVLTTEITTTPVSSNSSLNKMPGQLISPTTPSVPKERKRRIIIDDDDESPTFNPQRSTKKIRGKNRRKSLKQQRKSQQLLSASIAATINATEKPNESAVFTSPEAIDRRKLLIKDTSSTSLQVFEEDTRMSADSLFTSPTMRTTEFLQNDESQSSLHSSTSATVENSAKKVRSKIEVVDPEGRTEFTVDMIAEYDWPPPKGCCPSRNRDTFMVQEQIAEYLGVKSFKRKYPDLPRRMVEMEERNYLLEKGLVSEKMCDLGLTAVLASDVLDIMNNDFYEKYEEYRRYLREKQIRDLAARQKQMQVHSKSLSARENAMRAASMWNADFNRSRVEGRRECLDLQNFVVQTPDFYRKQRNRPAIKPSHYPVALVPGQFQDYYRKYNAAELLCYPINTVLAEPYDLDRKLREYCNRVRRSHYNSDDESGDDSDSSSDSDTDDSDSSSDSSSSSDESDVEVKKEGEDKANDVKPPIETKNPVPKMEKSERDKCQICSGPERCNAQQKPEIFVSCTTCKRNTHPTCLKMSARMVRRVNEYAWQCKKCKYCIKCRRGDNEDKMLFCDQCDRSYHIYCIGLRKIPNGKWHCAVCTVCTLCGARRPEGHNNPNLTIQQKQKLLAVAKWTHEYQENPSTGEEEHVSMLCTSCVAIKHSAAKNVYFN